MQTLHTLPNGSIIPGRNQAGPRTYEMGTLATSAPKGAPDSIPDLSDKAVRSDLSPAAIEAFVRLIDIWRVNSKQAAALLGDMSERTWFRVKSGDSREALSQDALTRVSALVGLYKGLHLLFSDPLADDWVKRPNTESLFAGRSPLQFMIEGGIPSMLLTRGYIDALRGGL